MGNRKRSYFILCLFLPLIFCACVPQKKVVPAKKQLTVVNAELTQSEVKLNALEEARLKKQEDNQIDDSASARMGRLISETNNGIHIMVAENTVTVGETVVNRADWDRLNAALAKSQQTSKTINEKISLLTDLINRNTVVRLDQDLLFDPGQYEVSASAAAAVTKFFIPACKEIDSFISKYPDFPLSIIITAVGYADGSSIMEGTPLFKTLVEKSKLNVNPPDNKELNKALSRARAEDVIGLFQKFTLGTGIHGSNIKGFSYIHEGKGEAFPNPKVTDYKTNDPRRRIVLLYWSVFPD